MEVDPVGKYLDNVLNWRNLMSREGKSMFELTAILSHVANEALVATEQAVLFVD